MRLLLASLVALAVAVPASARGTAGRTASAKAFPFVVELHVLPNGVRLVLVPLRLAGPRRLLHADARRQPQRARDGPLAATRTSSST